MEMTESVEMAISQLSHGNTNGAMQTLKAAIRLVHDRKVRNDGGYCIHGHLMSLTNTYLRPDGYRECRQCIADRKSRYRATAGAVKPCRVCGGPRRREASGLVRCRACATKREARRRKAAA